jgi:putative FmdB family regulatory protein
MPFYEYQCNNCGHALEAMQKVSDPPLKKCPDCGKPQLRKLMSAPVFRLKGGGWYETDFKSDQDNKRNLADRPEDSSGKDNKDEKKEIPGPVSKDAPAADAAKTEKVAEKPAGKAPAADGSKKSAARSAPVRAGITKSKPRKRPARGPMKRSAKPARRR